VNSEVTNPVPSTAPTRAWRLRWVIVVVYTTGIVVGTTVPIPPGLPAPEGSDKLAHLLMYAGLGALFLWAMCTKPARREHARRVAALCILMTFIFCSLFGALDEWHQQFVGRTTSFADWTADAVGVLLGAVGMAGYLRRVWRDLRRQGNG